MMESNDLFRVMFRLRGSVARGRHGLMNEALYSRARAGTKWLVGEYQAKVVRALEYVATAPDATVPTDVRLAFFNETRHAFGRTAMLLSGGAANGIYHVGVLKALFEANLLPRVFAGASAGSIVAATVGVRTDPELRTMFRLQDMKA